MAHVKDISNASELLAEYCSSSNGYAWPLYDDDAARGSLTGVDLASPALLSYPIRSSLLSAMGQDGNEFNFLLLTMKKFVEDSGRTKSEFFSLDEEVVISSTTRKAGDPVSGPRDWQNLIACLDAVKRGRCKGLTSVAVTKILHRKRPDLVPIHDSRLRAFYGVQRHDYSQLFLAIHKDLHSNRTYEWLEKQAKRHVTPGGLPMTPLRALDIMVWMSFE